jgi:hypothetical protein
VALEALISRQQRPEVSVFKVALPVGQAAPMRRLVLSGNCLESQIQRSLRLPLVQLPKVAEHLSAMAVVVAVVAPRSVVVVMVEEEEPSRAVLAMQLPGGVDRLALAAVVPVLAARAAKQV